MTIHFYNRGAIDTISGGYIYNHRVIQSMRLFGHEVEYCEDIANLNNTENNIIDSLVLNEALEYINFEVCNVGLIHQVDRTVNQYYKLPLIVTGAIAKNDLIDNFDVEEQNIYVVRPGMDENWKVKTNYKSKIRNLLCVSNYVEGKGIDVLISALQKLRRYGWKLTIAGNKKLDPKYYDRIENLVTELELKEQITLLGSISRDEINDLMIEADIMVNFSENETYGMATQEAIHADLPVLMYKTGAWEEFLTSGIVKILDKYSQEALKDQLENIFELGLNMNKPDSWKDSSKRSWEIVGREIISILNSN